METEVLVVGAGPVGLMAAIELRRRGVDVVIVDKRTEIAPWAKAVGVQPRTLEIFDAIGVIREAIAASETLRGQLVYVNGEQAATLELALPPEVPYRFVGIPQYATEEVLGAHLADLGTTVWRGVEVTGFTADETGVTATARENSSDSSVSAQYLIGTDGAHSVVRKGLGLSFEGDAFPEAYMLADVEVDWHLPAGYTVRAVHQTDGVTDDLLVCIPLPGPGRYRVSMLVPDELAVGSGDAVAHGIATTGPEPELHHIQAVLDRMAPEPVTATNMRWSSVFRISHRLVDRYGVGRVFVAGDAAHIHPPTGAQGMNTGLQDAYNLGWKLALAVRGVAAPGLLDSYHAERHPVGEEVVGRTVRAAREGIGAGETDGQTALMRQAQLLIGYPDSPIVGGDNASEPAPGARAPDATGLRQDAVASPVRFHELLRHPGHTLLVWAPGDTRRAMAVTDEIAARTDRRVRGCIVVPAASSADLSGSILADDAGTLATAYGFGDTDELCLIRPDGYIGYRSRDLDIELLVEHLRDVMAVSPSATARR